jgi:hypothetical protein
MNHPISRLGQAIFDVRSDDRIRRHTSPDVNAKIDLFTRASIDEVVAGGRDAMVARLKELDREWDVDRALMTNFAVAGSVTHELGRHVHKGFTHFFHAQLGFLFMHAVVGWCPPLALFRRLGFRSAKEIAAERFAIIERLGPAPAE